MKRIIVLLTLFVALFLPSSAKKPLTNVEVLMTTTAGDIRLRLYDETPIHRDNFVKLVKSGFYEKTLFHRVIRDFMIQAGDPGSRKASRDVLLGDGDVGYSLEAEFRTPQLFHRRGVLAAARESDDVNPERRSSGCQFYIVWGRKLDERQLASVQLRLDRATGGTVKITDEQKRVYSEVGGTPHLDGLYTIFGEVVEGLDVVDSIQQCKTDKNDRPLDDIRILKAKIVKRKK